MELIPIGVINSPFKERGEAPIQPALSAYARGEVVVFEQYRRGLLDLDGFSHIFLIYFFDRAVEVRLVRRPFLDDQAHGVFAMRHPDRPNPVGLSVVRLLSMDEGVLEVEGIDILDGTPLLDIKPYVPGFDAKGEVRTGWLEGRDLPDFRLPDG